MYVHIINGLPGEDYDMMMATAKEVAQMDVQGIKIHLLHLLKGTPMVKQYDKGLLTFYDSRRVHKPSCGPIRSDSP